MCPVKLKLLSSIKIIIDAEYRMRANCTVHCCHQRNRKRYNEGITNEIWDSKVRLKSFNLTRGPDLSRLSKSGLWSKVEEGGWMDRAVMTWHENRKYNTYCKWTKLHWPRVLFGVYFLTLRYMQKKKLLNNGSGNKVEKEVRIYNKTIKKLKSGHKTKRNKYLIRNSLFVLSCYLLIH